MKKLRTLSIQIFFSFLIMSFIALFVSCNNIFSYDNENKSHKAKISFDFGEIARSAMPEVQVENLTNFILYKRNTQQNNYIQVKEWTSYKSIKNDTVEIDSGLYDFKMEAECSGMHYCAQITDKFINEGVNKLNFAFSLTGITVLSGEGNIEITLIYPADKTVRKITASLFTDEDIAILDYQDKSLQVNNGSAVYSVQNISGGTYHVLFKLFYDEQGTTLLTTYQETAIVTDGLKSSSIVTVTDLNPVYTITYELNGLEWKEGFAPQTSFTRLDEVILPGREAFNLKEEAVFYGWYTDNWFDNNRKIEKIDSTITNNITLYVKCTQTCVNNINYLTYSLPVSDEPVTIIITDTNPSFRNIRYSFSSKNSYNLDFSLTNKLSNSIIHNYYGYDSVNNYEYLTCLLSKNLITQTEYDAYLEELESTQDDSNYWVFIPVEYYIDGELYYSDERVWYYDVFLLYESPSYSYNQYLIEKLPSKNTTIKSIKLPENQEIIDILQFANLYNLESINIPKNVKTINKDAFKLCPNLKSINFEIPYGWYSSEGTSMDFALNDNYYPLVYESDKTYTKSDSVSINQLDALLSETTTSELAVIINDTLPDLIKLKNILTRYQNISISLVLSNCTQLTEIESNYLSGLKNLKNLVLPSSVIKIEKNSFKNCINLQSITFGKTEIWHTVDNVVSFNALSDGTVISVTNPETNATLLTSTNCNDYWYRLDKEINEINNLSINELFGFLKECFNNKNFDLNNDILGIKITDTNPDLNIINSDLSIYPIKCNLDLSLCTNLTSILSNDLRNAVSIQTIVLPDNLQSISAETFIDYRPYISISANNNYLKTSENNKLILSKDGKILYYSNYISGELIIPSTVTTISDYCFYNCNDISSVSIPKNVSKIYPNAFTGCTGVTNLYYNAVSITGISYTSSNHLFTRFGNTNDKLTVTIGKDVETIPDYCFYSNSNIQDVIFENNSSIKSIGYSAFYQCNNIINVFFNNSLFDWCNIDFSTSSSNPILYSKTLYLNGEQIVSISIPDTITEIKPYTFYNCQSLTNVQIPNSVTKIGNSAFSGCNNLNTITFSNSLTYIENSAFYSCRNLTELVLSDSITNIGQNAFSYCSNITSVTLPGSIESIGDSAFAYCSKIQNVFFNGTLEKWCQIDFSTSQSNPTNYSKNLYINNEKLSSISIPESIHQIKQYTFQGLKVNSIIIPNTVISISLYAFLNCSEITSIYYNCPNHSNFNYSSPFSLRNSSKEITITIGKDVISIPDYCFYENENIKTLNFENDIALNSIGNRAFYACRNLNSCSIPETVTSIGSYAFYNCSRITSLSIPNSVNSIGAGAFENCTGIKTLYFNCSNLPDFDSSSWNSTYCAFSNCGNSETQCILTIGKDVTSIPAACFYNSNISNIEYEGSPSISSIGNKSFSSCSYLNSVSIPNSVSSIGYSAFSGCSSLTSVNIPNSVTSIGHSAFSGCSSLTSVNIPNSVTSIGYSAFSGCSSFTSLNIPKSVISIGESAFSGCTAIQNLYFNCSVTNDSSNSIFSNFGNESNCILTIGKDVTTIPPYCFKDSNISNIIFEQNSSLSSISNNAFENCFNLTSLNIPNSVSYIGSRAFYNCSNLLSLNIPESVSFIGSNAFYYCTSIENLFFNSSSLLDFSYDNNIFSDIGNSDNPLIITIGKDVLTIPKYCFYNNKNIQTVIIEDRNIPLCINNNAFSGCNNINIVNFLGSIEKWCTFDFNSNPTFYSKTLLLNGEELTSLTIPESITEIKAYSFQNLNKISSLIIPNSVTSIGYGAFEGCSGITNLIIPNSVTSIGTRAFEDCSGINSLIIPNSVTSIDSYAFYNCTNIVSITIPSSIASFGSDAFSNCYNIEYVNFLGTIENWCKINFSNEYSNPIYYSRSLAINGETLTSLSIPDTITRIKKYSFYNCKNLTSVTIPASVNVIEQKAFSNCNILSGIIFENIENTWKIEDYKTDYYHTPQTYLAIFNSSFSVNDIYLNKEYLCNQHSNSVWTKNP